MYRSVSIPYSTPVSCMVSPRPNEDPVGTTKCPLNPWFYDILKLIPTTKLLSQKHQKLSTNICYHRPAFKCFSKQAANDSQLKLFASLLCTTLPAAQPKRQCFLKHPANDFSALPCPALQLRHKEYFNVDFPAHCLLYQSHCRMAGHTAPENQGSAPCAACAYCCICTQVSQLYLHTVFFWPWSV